VASKRPRCPSCSRELCSWGRTSSGKKRYGCRFCKKTRLYKQKTQKIDLFSLFRQYILWGNTYAMLFSLSGYSIRYLEETVHTYLETVPPVLPKLKQAGITEAFLLIDGLWFSRYFVLMVYRQSGNLYLLHIAVCGREVGTKIAKDLRLVKHMGYHFTGIVSDGETGIFKAVQEVFPHAPHQICLAHKHRDIIASIGRYPKQERIKELKILADHIWFIESREALEWWKEQVKDWIKRNRDYLKEKRYDIEYNSWYIHKGSRRTVTILQELPQTSFKFLDHPLMPKTTNELEAQFGHVGKRWLAHRGLKRERWEKYLKWFVYFYNKEKIS